MAIRAELVESYVRDLVDRLGPGALLPGERELAVSCGVSRMTVRRALDGLERRRLVERRHGAGTFVRRPTRAQPLMATSFHEDMRRRGMVPSSRLVGTTTTAATPDLAERLECADDDPVLVITRLRLADDVPMALETLRVPATRLRGLTGHDVAEGSYYTLLHNRFGRTVSTGRQTVEPVVLGHDEAVLLDTAPGAAALRFVRVSRDQHGEIVELVDALYRGDRYLIEVDLLPPGDLHTSGDDRAAGTGRPDTLDRANPAGRPSSTSRPGTAARANAADRWNAAR